MLKYKLDKLNSLSYQPFWSTSKYINDVDNLYFEGHPPNGVGVINFNHERIPNLPSGFPGYGHIVQFKNQYSYVGRFQLLTDINNKLYFRSSDGNNNWLPWRQIL